MYIDCLLEKEQLEELERLIAEATKDNALYTASKWELHVLEAFLIFCISALVYIIFK